MLQIDGKISVRDPDGHGAVEQIGDRRFFGFKIDFFNIDEYIPGDGRVESVVFAPQGYDDNYNYFDQEFGNINDYEYWIKNMRLEDKESVRKLAMLSMRRYDEALKVVGSEDEMYSYGDGSEFSEAVIIYRLRSGRLLSRKIKVPVNDPEALALLDTIMNNKDFVNGYFAEMKFDIDNCISDEDNPFANNNVFTDGIHSVKLTNAEVKDLLKLYRTDMDKFSFSARRDLWPMGFMDYEIKYSDEDGAYPDYHTYGTGRTLIIYPNMENCVRFLKDKGYDPSLQGIFSCPDTRAKGRARSALHQLVCESKPYPSRHPRYPRYSRYSRFKS